MRALRAASTTLKAEGPPTKMPPTKTRPWRQRAAMTAVFIANGIAFGAWAGNLPRLRESANLDDAALGIVLLCVSLGAVLAMQLVGRYAARIGTARSALIAAIALTIALPLPAFAPTWPTLLAAALLYGLALGGLDVSMNAHAAQLEQRWGAAIMSSFHAGWSLGELAGAAAAGLLAAAALPLPAAMTLSAIPLLACGLPAIFLPDQPGAPAETQKFAWPTRAMLAISAIAALSFSIEGAAADWSGVYLNTTLGASPALAATSLSAFAITMLACRLVGDYIVRRLGQTRTIQYGSLLAGTGLLAAILAPNVPVAAAGFALVGIGVANTIPILFSLAGQKGPANVAMMATAGYGAMMAAPPLIGLVSNAISLRTALLLLAAGTLAITLLAKTLSSPSPPTPLP